MKHRHGTYWAVQWRSDNALDGRSRHIIWADGPQAMRLFRTRRECRAYIEQRFGYIRTRPDLRAEPHGWRMPIPVLVTLEPAR